jgi:hypothetical protein
MFFILLLSIDQLVLGLLAFLSGTASLRGTNTEESAVIQAEGRNMR